MCGEPMKVDWIQEHFLSTYICILVAKFFLKIFYICNHVEEYWCFLVCVTVVSKFMTRDTYL